MKKMFPMQIPPKKENFRNKKTICSQQKKNILMKKTYLFLPTQCSASTATSSSGDSKASAAKVQKVEAPAGDEKQETCFW